LLGGNVVTDEIAKGPPTIKLGDTILEIVDTGIQISMCDIIVECRDTGMGAIQIGFASLRATGESADALVCARLRLSHGTAMDLRKALDNVLKSPVPKSETH
jgi:hypothetical protein